MDELEKYLLGLGVSKVGYADVNADGDVTIGDVVIENRHVLGKENLLEALQYLADVGDELTHISIDLL